MKTINLSHFLYVAFFLIFTMGCKQEELNKPIITNTNAPGVVSGVTVVNQNGKASLTYTLPGDLDLSYVKAVYEISQGKTREVKASYYTNGLVVDGFGDTLAHTVKLYAVNSSEVASAPVTVTVKPLTPVIKLVIKTLQVTAGFGGFNIICDNPTMENLAIVPLVDTTGNGIWVQTIGLSNIYSNSAKINVALRGQPSIPRKYAFFIRDRWLNQSDTLFLTLTPFFETLLPKNNWSNYVLPNDAIPWGSGKVVKNIYDGAAHTGFGSIWVSIESASSPQTITLDLGKAYTFSRFQIDPYTELGGQYYVRGNLKDFDIWGSNSPSLSGDYDASWTKLGTFSTIKPSGSIYGIETAADAVAGYAGWQFDFPTGLASYRYVRIRSLRNWQGSYFMDINEFTLWGK